MDLADEPPGMMPGPFFFSWLAKISRLCLPPQDGQPAGPTHPLCQLFFLPCSIPTRISFPYIIYQRAIRILGSTAAPDDHVVRPWPSTDCLFVAHLGGLRWAANLPE